MTKRRGVYRRKYLHNNPLNRKMPMVPLAATRGMFAFCIIPQPRRGVFQSEKKNAIGIRKTRRNGLLFPFRTKTIDLAALVDELKIALGHGFLQSQEIGLG